MDATTSHHEEIWKPESSPKQNGFESAVKIELTDAPDSTKLQKLCRTCLSMDSVMYTLVGSGLNDTLPDIFTSFTNIPLDPEEGLPLQICEHCRAQLLHSYEFRMKCLSSDCTLRSILQRMSNSLNAEDNNAENSLGLQETIEFEDEDKAKPQKLEDEFPDVQYLEEMSDSDQENVLCIDQDTASNHTEPQADKRIQTPEAVPTPPPKSESKVKKRKTTQRKAKTRKPDCVCDQCQKKFPNATSLKDHMKRVHSTQYQLPPNSCDQCKESFDSERDLMIHSALHSAEGNVWTCNECLKQFTHRGSLKRHIHRHMDSKRYTCLECGKRFAENYALMRHERVHTGQRPEKKHHCHLCDKRYSEGYLLAAHVARHTDERPCVCAECGKSFATQRLLNSHSLVHSDNKAYPCLYCEKRFRHESTRNTHHRTHTGERPYVCASCGKAFIQHCNLALHMRTHTGEKPYTCKTCHRCFSSGSTLKAHIRTHTGEKPYSCEKCGKRFSRAGLHAHCRLHANERAFACHVCARRFATGARLREHERVHTGEKPFECGDCKTKYTTRAQLVKHFKRHASKKRKPKKEKRKIAYPVKPITIDENKIGLCDPPDKVHILDSDILIDSIHEHPMEVSGELVLQNDGQVKTDLIEVDEVQTGDYQSGICLSNMNFVNNDASDMNLVTLNEEGVSISSSSAVLEGATVKLYQLDQSLVQIHSSGGQVTISKITSKMTANF